MINTIDRKQEFTMSPVIRNHTFSASTPSDTDSIMSKEDYRLAERVIECGFLPVLSLLGLPANIVNMLVFYRQGLRDKMNLCLFLLAFVDFMYLLSMLLSTLYCPAAFLSDRGLEQILKWHIRKHVINFVYAFWYSSGTLTAIIATERCICVVWPIKSATLFKTKTMAYTILGAMLLIHCLCLTYALKHVAEWTVDKHGNRVVVLKDTTLFLSHKIPFQIITDTILPSISFLTFFVVSVVTAVTVRQLRTAMDWRQKSSSHGLDKRQMSLVRVLITVSCVYIACNAPKVSLAMVRFLVHDFSTSGKFKQLFFITHRAGHVLLMVNGSVNVFIYYVQSSRFRAQLQAVWRPCCKAVPETHHANGNSALSTITS